VRLFKSLGALAICLAWGLALPAFGGMKKAVGFAEGTYPFQVNGKKIERNTTLFEGETVTSALLPTQLSIAGGRFGLGIASQARVFENRLVFDGGSLRLMGATAGVGVEAAGLKVASDAAGTVATIYASRPDQLSIAVESGEVSVSDAAGKEIARANSSAVTTIRDSRASAKVDTSSAPLEVAEIQAKQAEHLGTMEQSISGAGFGEKSRTLLGILAGASGGMVGIGGRESAPAASSNFSGAGLTGLGGGAQTLQAASIQVGRQLQSDATTQAGCSTYQECYPIPVISDNRPYGIVTGVIVLPGCSFCFLF
jgi:hypothetical protein